MWGGGPSLIFFKFFFFLAAPGLLIQNYISFDVSENQLYTHWHKTLLTPELPLTTFAL